jgi:hypothetical protein
MTHTDRQLAVINQPVNGKKKARTIALRAGRNQKQPHRHPHWIDRRPQRYSLADLQWVPGVSNTAPLF